MTPSPPAAGGDDPSSSKNKFRFRSEARNSGVGAFHVIPISDENDSQVEPLETATVENVFSTVEVSQNETLLSQQEQDSLQRGVIVEASDGETIEEKRVEHAATSTTSRSDDGNGEFSRGTVAGAPVGAPTGSPTASPTAILTEINHYCDESRVLPAIDSDTIATRTDRFHALQSVLETELVDYDTTAFDDPCGPHNFALQWLADEDGLQLQLEPDAMEAVYQRFVVALFYFSTHMYSTTLASHSNQ
eukprot:scaffold42434_cov29-Attheya_sp.AAC.1